MSPLWLVLIIPAVVALTLGIGWAIVMYWIATNWSLH